MLQGGEREKIPNFQRLLSQNLSIYVFFLKKWIYFSKFETDDFSAARLPSRIFVIK